MISDDTLDMVETADLIRALARRMRSMVIAGMHQGELPDQLRGYCWVGGKVGPHEPLGLAHDALTMAELNVVNWRAERAIDPST